MPGRQLKIETVFSLLGASNPFVKFLHALQVAKVKVVDGQKILLLKTSIGGIQAAGNTIIIRNAWTNLFQLAFHGLSIPNAQNHKVLFLGKSGCGNSWFAYFWIWKLLDMAQKILYHVHDSFYLINRESVETIPSCDLHYLDADVWYLSDPKPGQQPFSPCSWKTIFFGSLGVSPYNSFRRTYTLTYYIPCWTWPEIYFLGIHCSTLSPAKIQTITCDWGNVPRCVASDPKDSLKYECAKVKCLSSMLEDVISGKVTDDTFPFSLLQLQPSQDYDKMIFNFASPRVQDLVFLEMIRWNRRSLQDFLIKDPRPSFALLRFQLFETLTHHWLRGAGQCRASSLELRCSSSRGRARSSPGPHPDTAETLSFQFQGYLKETRSFRYVPKETIMSGKYIQTGIKTGDFFDSFAFSDGSIFFFSILMQPAEALDRQQVRSLSILVTQKLGRVPIRFVFVLPTFVHESVNSMFELDAATRSDGKGSQGPGGDGTDVECEQFVTEIDVISEIERLDYVHVRN